MYKKSDKFYERSLLFFMAGFLIGLLFIYIGRDVLVKDTVFLNEETLQKLRIMNTGGSRLFGYCIRARGSPAAVLIVAALCGFGSPAVCLYLIWCGFGAGTVLSVFCIRFGIRGPVLFLAGIVPQIFLLLPAYLVLFRWCVERNRGKSTLAAACKLLLPLSLIWGGCFLEGMINPWILELIMRYL